MTAVGGLPPALAFKVFEELKVATDDPIPSVSEAAVQALPSVSLAAPALATAVFDHLQAVLKGST